MACFLLLYATLKAQSPQASYTFAHLSINNGLASNHVSAILQDRKGFIWIASTALQRYDGSNLLTVASFDRVPGSIYYDDICLCEDRAGRIWMGAPDNIRVYDPVTGSVKTLKVDIMPATNGNLQCSRIVQDHDGIIWATSQEGLLRFSETSGSFEKAAMIPEPVRAQMNSGIIEDSSGRLWISGLKGIFILDKDRKRLYSATDNPEHLPVFQVSSSVKKFYIDKQQRIWIAARSPGLYRYDPLTGRMQYYAFFLPGDRKTGAQTGGRSAGSDMVFDMAEDMDGQIWVATEQGGIYRYDSEKDVFALNIRANNEDEQGLHYNFETNCLFHDREGHLWAGTDRGVNILSVHNRTFRMLDHRTVFSGTAARLPRGEVTDLFQATNGDVYAGYWGKGFSWLNARLELKRNFVHERGNTAHGLPEPRDLVWSFAEMKNGHILVGQENGFLSVFDPAKGGFAAHYRPDVFQEQTLMDLNVASDTAVWVGLYKKGLARWNPRLQQFYDYPQLIDQLKRPTTVMDIVTQGDSLLWLATSTDGLLAFNPHSRQIVTKECFGLGPVTINNITCLYRSDDTTLVAGTDHGLWVYNIPRRTVQPLKINGLLFDEWVLSMRDDGQEGIWFTTQYGFYRFNRKVFNVETFVQSDGIIDNNRKVRRRIRQLSDGQLLVGASDHFLSFDPAELKVAPPPPDVTILTLRAMDSTKQIEQAMSTRQPVTLTYKQNFITVEFKSLQYHQEKIRYYYRLEGLDENWVSAEGLLVAKYTNLPPGNYTFKVRSVNPAGTFSNNITALDIHIRPAFWQTLWFRVLCLLLIAALVYLYFRIRVHHIKKEARNRAAIQQQMAQLEMKALRAQMNPHFIFNALNSIQTFMMKSETEQALSYLGRFARLIRNVLDNSQLNSIPISKEVNILENYMELEKLRFADQFEYRISVDPSIDADFTEIPPMIIQPFIENAIWHGLLHKKEKGKLIISFLRMQNGILCTIEDNGIGREKSAALKQLSGNTHYSRGLQITRDRLTLFNSRFNMEATFDIEDLVDRNGQPGGTKASLWFPLMEG